MSTEQGNRLAGASSGYLRSARHQPVDWHEWSEEAFRKAQAEDKPVLLDIGAVWCHWCHVMDRESYENADTAALINELFVAIKVDRDERPDIDTRYQAAVAAISGQGGWPLTAFLTPEGKPYFGGTYFPPEERYGRPSFQRVLGSMAQAYRGRRDEVEESAASVMTAIEQNETFTEHGALNEDLLAKVVEAMLQQFDARNGGFGSQPKFPHPAALDVLLDTASRSGPQAARAREVVAVTLRTMAAGGMHDQLAGGFHRYSVDERWAVPHFEKMAYDNSELLRVYTHAFQSFVDPALAKVAGSTVAWMDACLSDREQGGFYGSQDADESLDDDGDYFTWTLREVEAVLSADEFAVANAYFNVRAVGDMHHNPAKNVLQVVGHAASIASRFGYSEDEARVVLEAVRVKMAAARLRRPTPYIDRTIYTGWNGLCISAYLAAGRALALPDVTAFALKSLDRVLDAAWDGQKGLGRVVRYGEAGGERSRVPAVLEDYAYLGMAALDAWEATGVLRYFTAAKGLADRALEGFYDSEGGGFFDTEQTACEALVGALRAKRKPLQDAPTPAGNPVTASLLLRLYALTDERIYEARARQTLEIFGGLVEHLGLPAASYAQALRRLISPPVQVCIVGEDELAEELAAAATARFLLNKSVVRLRREQLEELPPALAATLPALASMGSASVALVCHGSHCEAPVSDPGRLLEMLAPRTE